MPGDLGCCGICIATGPDLDHRERHRSDRPVDEFLCEKVASVTYEEVATVPMMDKTHDLNLNSIVYAADFSLC
jgi:hypothetical protein